MKTLTVWTRCLALVFACVLGLSATAVAQETTSRMRGTITSPDGAPVAGASVNIIHTPTGSATSATTTVKGGAKLGH